MISDCTLLAGSRTAIVQLQQLDVLRDVSITRKLDRLQ